MLPLFPLRAAISVPRSTAAYAHILSSFASTLHSRNVLDSSLRTDTVQSFANPQRNASTKVTAATNNAKSSTKSGTADRNKPREKLTPEEIAALRAKAKLERQKAGEAKKLEIIKPPPRAMRAFSLFVQDAQKPVSDCAGPWKSLSEEKRQEYTARAQVIQAKRREEFDAFVKTVTLSEIKRYNRHVRSTGRGWMIHSKSTGRPLSSFLRYLKEFRTQPDQAGKPVTEVSKAAGSAWQSLTQEEKDKYKSFPSKSTIA